MTQKELLYIEDAIGHESNMIKICESTIEMLEDDAFVKFLEKELKKHNSMKEKLITALEDCTNE